MILSTASMSEEKNHDAYHLLEISRAELEKLIQDQLQENPALELDDAAVQKTSKGEKHHEHALVPDVRVEQKGRQFVVALTDESRRLRVNPLYERMATQKVRLEGRVDYPFFIEKARSARWFIKAVEQRQAMLLRVTEGIFKFQRELLQHGLNHIRAMTVSEVAEDIRLPESVVLRAAANKWVETPHAIFALDWFFAPSRTNAQSAAR
jgi:DNA-directed RNA polymerase specialized sigma54-like protein